MNRVREALRGAAEFTLGRGLVARAAESVAWPKPSGEYGGDDALLARVEGAGAKHAAYWFNEKALLVVRACKLLHNAAQRGAVKMVPNGVG